MLQPIIDLISAHLLEVLVTLFGVVLSYGVLLLKRGLRALPAVLVAMAVQLEAKDADDEGIDDNVGKVLRIVGEALRQAVQQEMPPPDKK